MTEPPIFQILADGTRRRILELLRARERPVGELVEEVGLSQPAVSRHLRVLREAGVVASRVDAQRRLYRLRPDALRELDAWLEPYRLLWSGRLDALEDHLNRGSDDERDGA
ncbi:MAG: ArsR/SmtB family transcription factor [Longimicrobiales bacterium]